MVLFYFVPKRRLAHHKMDQPVIMSVSFVQPLTAYSIAEPPVTIQQANAATVKAPVYTLPVRR